MQKTLTIVVVTSLLGSGLIYADNQAAVTPQHGSAMTQKQRIQRNFKEIERLFTSINNHIQNIEKKRNNINHMIANQANESMCVAIESLNKDIEKLEKRIATVNDNTKKTKLQNELNDYKSTRDEAKANFNYKCSEL